MAEDKKKIQLLYGTGNQAKIQFVRRAAAGLPIEITSLWQAAEESGVTPPKIQETGSSPLENARVKAKAYYETFKRPVFSCDCGLYLWNYRTKEKLPAKEQPGIRVRERNGHRLTDEELLLHYIGLVKKYGPILAKYENGICLTAKTEYGMESMEESFWGEAFLLTDKPHPKRVQGFPLDSISLEIKSGRYYYDLEGNLQDDVAAQKGFRQFFENVSKNAVLRGK